MARTMLNRHSDASLLTQPLSRLRSSALHRARAALFSTGTRPTTYPSCPGLSLLKHPIVFHSFVEERAAPRWR
jgi:hypothetical protein